MYIVCLLGALGGLAALDARYSVVFWRNAKRSAVLIGIGLLFFLAWDICGIKLHIFQIGTATYMTGLQLAPQLPIEEPVFLLLLLYQAAMALELFRRRYEH